MSEIGDCFAALRQEGRVKKSRNLEFATKYLIDNNIVFESKNCGLHLIVSNEHLIIDYWPSTGLFKVRGHDYQGRGINTLAGIINGSNVPRKLRGE